MSRPQGGEGQATTMMAGPRPRNRGPAMAALFIALFFAVASNTMVLTGLPQIIGDLDGTAIQYTWIVTTSLLVLAVTTPVWGRLTDRFSATKLLMAALALYFVGSLGAGSALEPWSIVACRVLIGAGAGGIVTLVQLIVTAMTSTHERPAFFGALGSVTSVAALLAPALGGFIVDLGGWRWVFYSTAPVALIALLMIWRFTPVIVPELRASGRFDVAGTVIIAVAATAAMVALSLIQAAPIAAAIAGGTTIVLTIASVLVERRATNALIPPRLIRDRRLIFVLITSGVGGVAAFGTSVYLAMYFQDVQGATAGESGLLLIPLSAATLVSSLSVGYFVTRTGRDKAALMTGLALVVIGYAMLTFLERSTSAIYVIGAGVLVSLGIGAVGQQIVATGQRFLSRDDTAVGSSLILFLRSLSTVLCLSGFGAMLAFVAVLVPGPSAVLDGIRVVFCACLALALIGVLAAVGIPSRRHDEVSGNVRNTPCDEAETAR